MCVIMRNIQKGLIQNYTHLDYRSHWLNSGSKFTVAQHQPFVCILKSLLFLYFDRKAQEGHGSVKEFGPGKDFCSRNGKEILWNSDPSRVDTTAIFFLASLSERISAIPATSRNNQRGT